RDVMTMRTARGVWPPRKSTGTSLTSSPSIQTDLSVQPAGNFWKRKSLGPKRLLNTKVPSAATAPIDGLSAAPGSAGNSYSVSCATTCNALKSGGCPPSTSTSPVTTAPLAVVRTTSCSGSPLVVNRVTANSGSAVGDGRAVPISQNSPAGTLG